MDEPTNKDEQITVRVARLEERFAASEAAKVLAAHATALKLLDLNHAARNREERDKGFVSLDKFEGLQREFQTFKDSVNSTLHELGGNTSGERRSRANVYQVIGAVIAVGMLAVAVIVGLILPGDP